MAKQYQWKQKYNLHLNLGVCIGSTYDILCVTTRSFQINDIQLVEEVGILLAEIDWLNWETNWQFGHFVKNAHKKKHQ